MRAAVRRGAAPATAASMPQASPVALRAAPF